MPHPPIKLITTQSALQNLVQIKAFYADIPVVGLRAMLAISGELK